MVSRASDRIGESLGTKLFAVMKRRTSSGQEPDLGPMGVADRECNVEETVERQPLIEKLRRSAAQA